MNFLERHELENKIDEAYGYLEHKIHKWNPSHLIAMMSGGTDSLVASHLLMNFDKGGRRKKFVCHVNTGIGIKQTREYVRYICDKNSWKLKEYKATEHTQGKQGWGDGSPDPQRYRDLVVPPTVEEREEGHGGFPRSTKFGHQKMYNRLKQRQVERMARETKMDWDGRDKYFDKLILATGIRRAESNRWMNLKEQDREGSRVWSNPIINWTKKDVMNYIEMYDLEINPVTQLIHMSGECLCGAYAHFGELSEIAVHFPKTAARIYQLEQFAYLHGYPIGGWEEGSGPYMKKCDIDHPEYDHEFAKDFGTPSLREYEDKHGELDRDRPESNEDGMFLCNDCQINEDKDKTVSDLLDELEIN